MLNVQFPYDRMETKNWVKVEANGMIQSISMPQKAEN